MAITATTPHNVPLAADHPRRFSIQRDMSNGLYDVWDSHKFEYVVCDVRRTTAERVVETARVQAFALLIAA